MFRTILCAVLMLTGGLALAQSLLETRVSWLVPFPDLPLLWGGSLAFALSGLLSVVLGASLSSRWRTLFGLFWMVGGCFWVGVATNQPSPYAELNFAYGLWGAVAGYCILLYDSALASCALKAAQPSDQADAPQPEPEQAVSRRLNPSAPHTVPRRAYVPWETQEPLLRQGWSAATLPSPLMALQKHLADDSVPLCIAPASAMEASRPVIGLTT